MKIDIDGHVLHVREFCDGKLSLMTRDEKMKHAIDVLRKEAPEELELLTDPELDEDPADSEGVMMAVVDARRTALVIDLETGHPALAVWAEVTEDDDGQ